MARNTNKNKLLDDVRIGDHSEAAKMPLENYIIKFSVMHN